MNREEFLKELEFLLSDIHEDERQEALSFYHDYFDEAGKENEQKIINELGSPQRVAVIIKDSINGHFEENITSSEEGFTNKNYEQVYEVQEIKKDEHLFDKFNKLTIGYKALLVFLLIFMLLPLTALLIDALGLGMSLLISIFTIIFGAWIVTFVLFVFGVVCIVSGVLIAFTTIPLGIILVGAGMMLIALSMLSKELAKIVFHLIKMLFKKIKTLFNGTEETV